MKTFTDEQQEVIAVPWVAPADSCVICFDPSDGELICVRCDIREDARARRREDV